MERVARAAHASGAASQLTPSPVGYALKTPTTTGTLGSAGNWLLRGLLQPLVDGFRPEEKL